MKIPTVARQRQPGVGSFRSCVLLSRSSATLRFSDIMINGERAVFFEKHGRLERLPDVTIPEKSLQVAARNIARSLGAEISEESPLLDSRLPDGSRVAIVLFPVLVGGTSVTIRKFQNKRYNALELVRVGTLTAEVIEALQKAV